MPAKKKTARKKRATKVETIFFAKVDRYHVTQGKNLNTDILRRQTRYDDTEVYDYLNVINITGTCIESDERDDAKLYLSIYAADENNPEIGGTLESRIIRDKDGAQATERYRGETYYKYDVPTDVGYIKKNRGEHGWHSFVRFPHREYDRLLTLLWSRCLPPLIRAKNRESDISSVD